MTLLSLPDYIATQATERYRAFIVHGPAMSGKTRLARRMHEVLGAHVLDLQARFVADPDLCAHMDRYRPRDLEHLLLCVNATLGGPATAAAMAIAKGWPRLVLPAVLVGIWGYVIGTPLGLLVGRLLMLW